MLTLCINFIVEHVDDGDASVLAAGVIASAVALLFGELFLPLMRLLRALVREVVGRRLCLKGRKDAAGLRERCRPVEGSFVRRLRR